MEVGQCRELIATQLFYTPVVVAFIVATGKTQEATRRFD